MNHVENKKTMNINTTKETSTIMSMQYNPVNNEYIDFIKRAQKIVTALYMLTSLIQESDPLYQVLRSKGTEMLGSMHTASNVSDTRDTVLYNIHGVLCEINSYIEVAYKSGFFSEMNYSLINNEIVSFANAILNTVNSLENKKKKNKHLEDFHSLFSQSIRNDEKSITVTELVDVSTSAYNSTNREKKPDAQQHEHTPKNDLVDSQTTSLKSSQEKIKDTSSVLKSKIDFKKELRSLSVKKTPLITRKKSVRKPKSNDAKDARKSQIISILSTSETSSINDIYDQFKDCSSKTIQRDLNELIDEGKVQKQGSRRWSTYSLRS